MCYHAVVGMVYGMHLSLCMNGLGGKDGNVYDNCSKILSWRWTTFNMLLNRFGFNVYRPMWTLYLPCRYTQLTAAHNFINIWLFICIISGFQTKQQGSLISRFHCLWCIHVHGHNEPARRWWRSRLRVFPTATVHVHWARNLNAFHSRVFFIR